MEALDVSQPPSSALRLGRLKPGEIEAQADSIYGASASAFSNIFCRTNR
jgi:hypothetical protein